MNRPAHVDLVRRLIAQLDGALPHGSHIGEIPAERYRSAAWFSRERAAVFARLPQIVALDAELAEPGACLAVDVAGVPLVVVRRPDGEVAAFRNACRHRSTQLVTAGPPCTRKAFVCPYHGWTYELGGRLVHVPHESAFADRHADRMALVPAHAESRHGFVWAGLEPLELDAFLGPISGDLEALGAASHHAYRRTTRDVRGNWKLVIDAFLDGYHVRHLHRDTVYRFFLDGCSEAELAGPHIRALTARRALVEARGVPLEHLDLRSATTPSYLVFPNVVLVLHPDFASVLVAAPVAADHTRVTHWMLVPHPARSEADEAHWAKSFALIDGGVFEREDFGIVESMQRGLEAGANETLLFGTLEQAALWFHETVDRVIATAAG